MLMGSREALGKVWGYMSLVYSTGIRLPCRLAAVRQASRIDPMHGSCRQLKHPPIHQVHIHPVVRFFGLLPKREDEPGG